MNYRTSSRTQYYVDAEMTALIRPRFPEELMKAVESTAPGTEVYKIHDNWKIARYEPGQSFPAHFDQGTRDSAMITSNLNGLILSSFEVHKSTYCLSNMYYDTSKSAESPYIGLLRHPASE